MNERWDRWFLGLAEYVATASKDPSTKCGAVIVRPDKTIASVGYNGFPRGMRDDPEMYQDRLVKYARILHAEINAILNAHSPVTGCTLYTWPLAPCERCAVQVIQAGIVRVMAPEPPRELAERWNYPMAMAERYFREAGVNYSLHAGGKDEPR